MDTNDAIGICTALKEAGAPAHEVYSAAKANQLERFETVRLLRSLFGLSLAATKDLMATVDGPAPSERPTIETREQLLQILSAELGHCTCASAEALDTLARFLEAAQKRTDAAPGEEFSAASRALEASLPFEAHAGLADWFVYGLEQRDLVEHQLRVTDVWITSKGRWLLEAIQRVGLVLHDTE